MPSACTVPNETRLVHGALGSHKVKMHWSAQLCVVVAIATLIVAALHDLAVRTVPNALIAALGVCALILAALQHRLLASVAISILLLLTAFALWLRRYLGGADAKLLAVCTLLVAPGSVLPMLLATALAGGVLCLPYISGRFLLAPPVAARPDRTLARLLRCERWRLRRQGPLPYAVAIAAGTLFVLLPVLLHRV